MDKTELKILGITFNQVQVGAYTLIMAEENGKRRVPIIVGTPEARSIAGYLENLHPPRPLTHDLFTTFIQKLNITLKEVNIYKYEDGVFHSEMTFIDEKKELFLDSRTSDAIALALRSNAPVYIANDIMAEVAIEFEENDEDFNDDSDQSKDGQYNFLDRLSPEKLQKHLNEAVALENYEKASYIRDLIDEKIKGRQ